MLLICCPWGEMKITLPRGVYAYLVEQPNLDGGPPEHRPFLGFIVVLNNPRYILDAGMHCLRVKLIWKLLARGSVLTSY